MLWCQSIDLLNFETCPGSLLNFGTTNLDGPFWSLTTRLGGKGFGIGLPFVALRISSNDDDTSRVKSTSEHVFFGNVTQDDFISCSDYVMFPKRICDLRFLEFFLPKHPKATKNDSTLIERLKPYLSSKHQVSSAIICHANLFLDKFQLRSQRSLHGKMSCQFWKEKRFRKIWTTVKIQNIPAQCNSFSQLVGTWSLKQVQCYTSVILFLLFSFINL